MKNKCMNKNKYVLAIIEETYYGSDNGGTYKFVSNQSDDENYNGITKTTKTCEKYHLYILTSSRL